MGLENPLHLLFLGAVALLVLGPKRLPDLAKALGKGVREFREAINLGEDREKPASTNGAAPAAAQPPAPQQPQLPPAQGTTAPPSED
jgi:sec-independent protein translocase protein TatA